MGGRIWFTIGRGILTEIYYPTVDRPQLRDLEFLFSDGNGLFLEEKQDLDYQVEGISNQPTRFPRTFLFREGNYCGINTPLRAAAHEAGRKP
jgi:glucoamylase